MRLGDGAFGIWLKRPETLKVPLKDKEYSFPHRLVQQTGTHSSYQMTIKERGDLLVCFLGLRRTIVPVVLSMRLCLKDL